MLAEVINLKVDYHTINSNELALQAKYILDKCIEWNKHIVLSILVEPKINVEKLIAFLTMGAPKYSKFIHEVEI